jgi:hypothetical protein
MTHRLEMFFSWRCANSGLPVRGLNGNELGDGRVKRRAALMAGENPPLVSGFSLGKWPDSSS